MLGAMSVGRGTVAVSSSLNASGHTHCRGEEAVNSERSGRSFPASSKITICFTKRFLVRTALGTWPSLSFISSFLVFTFDGQVAFLRGTLSPKQATL